MGIVYSTLIGFLLLFQIGGAGVIGGNGVVGGGTSTPSFTSTLVDYYDAASLTCTSGGGTAAPTWTDSGTGGRNLSITVGGANCVSSAIGTNSAVEFNNASYYTASSTIPCTAPCNVYMVFTPSFGTGSERDIFGSTVNDTSSLDWQVPNSSGNMSLNQNYTLNIVASTSPGLTNTTPTEVTFCYTSGGAATIYQTTSSGTAPAVVGSGSGGTITQGLNIVGASWHGSAVAAYMSGYVAFLGFSTGTCDPTSAHAYFAARGLP